MPIRARILLLTEDRGKQGYSAVLSVLNKAFLVMDAYADLNPSEVLIDPLPENEDGRKALGGNQWKAWKPSLPKERLLAAIAAQLRVPDGFVVFHVDADQRWSRRESSENRQKFDANIRAGVAFILQNPLPPVGVPGRAPPGLSRAPRLSDEDIQRALSRLILMSPCYSIESWLYQATQRVLTHCQGSHASREHQELIISWGKDRTLLDEVWRPKDEALGECVADKHNQDLSAVFPAEDVGTAWQSFFEFVTALGNCSALKESLKAPRQE